MKPHSHAALAHASNTRGGKPFSQMSRSEIIRYFLRVAVCFLTFGFVFTDALNG